MTSSLFEDRVFDSVFVFFHCVITTAIESFFMEMEAGRLEQHNYVCRAGYSIGV